MDTKEIIELENKFGAKNYKPLDVVLERGKGIWVWDVEGNKYMDCLAAYSAVNQGHCHPKIVNRLKKQAEKLCITSRAFRNDQLSLFYKDICKLTNSHMVLPMNSGAEAVETVIKAVRKWGYRTKNIPDGKAEIIVCENNFHGRTMTIIGFSTEEKYKEDFGPFTPGFKAIPFGDAKALESAITKNTVAFLVEPIQGEAGVIIPPDGYLKDIRNICTKNSVALIFDEIQTGLGRTGNEEVLGVFLPGEHGSTFGGNPLACAVAREALKVLIDEGMIENAADLGNYFQEKLKEIPSPYIKEIRGKGLLIGVELNQDAGGARPFCERLMKKGLLCKETHDNVIRFAPPLIITQQEIDWALIRIREVLVP